MYEENVMQQGLSENGFPQTVPNFITPSFTSSMEELSFHQNPTEAAAMEMEELQHQMGFDRNTPLLQELVNGSNQFHLPSSSFSYPDQTQNSACFLPTLGFLADLSSNTHSASASNSAYFDPLFHLNLPPPQPPLFRDLNMFQSPLPNGGYSMNTSSLFGGVVDEREGSGGGYGFNNGVFEFTGGDRNCWGRRSNNGKGSNKQLNTEKQRRGQTSDKYKVLSNLLPNLTKPDRASVVGDAIGYVKELLRNVNELKMLVERKRCSRDRIKRPKTENDDPDSDQAYYGMRNSWLHRKFKDSDIDVRIVDDEVTIKIAYQQKKINCLLPVSKALDELQLDIQHVGGGLVGDSYSFLFNSKICEGSSVYASAIANKIIEVVDKQYPAIRTNQ
ncbi:hypothetical protein Vadar_011143 [Vaccinium darrowii]|uniref:Uncharacterized protein n=1 Tax=Vaccinium darrowii TaxID=229202 RepID=A0ACB7Y616_9ERIC|nr:hypothetical protein Vadar_011143 [Vaccinium darrowii]